MIESMASAVQQPEPSAADRLVLARAVAGWLAADSIAAIGQGMAASIFRHRRVTGRQPSWAEALAGIDSATADPELVGAVVVSVSGTSVMMSAVVAGSFAGGSGASDAVRGRDSTSPACCALALTSSPQQSRDPIGIALRVIDAMTRMGTEYILLLNVIYGGSWMTKRLIDLDDELLARAGRELATSGVSDTVRLALQQATPAAARARQVDWLTDGGMAELTDSEARATIWR
jgi:Arc/MetJ family transcription regulator